METRSRETSVLAASAHLEELLPRDGAGGAQPPELLVEVVGRRREGESGSGQTGLHGRRKHLQQQPALRGVAVLAVDLPKRSDLVSREGSRRHRAPFVTRTTSLFNGKTILSQLNSQY